MFVVTYSNHRISDPEVMRALAHPARMAIMEAMYGGREGTATEFAEICGLSPSATSYHLRALAKVGMIEEAPGRGDGRERNWRSVHRGGYEVSGGPLASAEGQRAERDMLAAFLQRQNDRAATWAARMGEESPEWYDAAMLADTILLVTPEELVDLNKQVVELMRPYSRRERESDPPEGGRQVAVTYRALPL